MAPPSREMKPKPLSRMALIVPLAKIRVLSVQCMVRWHRRELVPRPTTLRGFDVARAIRRAALGSPRDEIDDDDGDDDGAEGVAVAKQGSHRYLRTCVNGTGAPSRVNE